MGEGHGFGGPRGSAGVEQDRDLVDLRQRMPGGQRGRRRRQIVPGGNTRGNPSAQVAALGPSRGHRQPQGQTAGPRQASRQVDGKDSQIPHPGAIEGAGGLDEACQGLLPGDDDASAVELDLLADLRGRGQRVVLGDDGADPPCGVGDDHVLGAVGQDDADDVAAPHPQAPQGLGGPGDLLRQPGVGGARPQEVDGDAVGEAAGGVVEHARERLGDGRNDPGHAGRVVRALVARGVVGTGLGHQGFLLIKASFSDRGSCGRGRAAVRSRSGATVTYGSVTTKRAAARRAPLRRVTPAGRGAGARAGAGARRRPGAGSGGSWPRTGRPGCAGRSPRDPRARRRRTPAPCS